MCYLWILHNKQDFSECLTSVKNVLARHLTKLELDKIDYLTYLLDYNLFVV